MFPRRSYEQRPGQSSKCRWIRVIGGIPVSARTRAVWNCPRRCNIAAWIGITGN